MIDDEPKIETYDELKKRALDQKKISLCAMDW